MSGRFATLALLAIVAGVIVFALARLLSPAGSGATPLDALKFAYGPKDHAAALALANNRVQLGTERVAARPQDWINQESYGQALLARARLTGSFDDLQAAVTAIDRGKASAVPGSGPLLAAAVVNFTVHRLAPIGPDLNVFLASAVPPERADRAEAEGLLGDVDFYSGRYDTALKRYRLAQGIEDDAGVAFRLALFALKTDQRDAAQAEFERSARINKGRTHQFMGNVWLQLGVVELSRGRWDEAEDLFRKA